MKQRLCVIRPHAAPQEGVLARNGRFVGMEVVECSVNLLQTMHPGIWRSNMYSSFIVHLGRWYRQNPNSRFSHNNVIGSVSFLLIKSGRCLGGVSL